MFALIVSVITFSRIARWFRNSALLPVIPMIFVDLNSLAIFWYRSSNLAAKPYAHTSRDFAIIPNLFPNHFEINNATFLFWNMIVNTSWLTKTQITI